MFGLHPAIDALYRKNVTTGEYEGKTFIEEEDGVLVGCQVGQNRTYCSVCDWDECIDRERASFPEEVAP